MSLSEEQEGTVALATRDQQSFHKHQALISWFHREYMKPELAPRELGRALQKAFQMRCDADYGNLASPSREETRELLDAAHKFATAIAQLLGR